MTRHSYRFSNLSIDNRIHSYLHSSRPVFKRVRSICPTFSIEFVEFSVGNNKSLC